jgi:hypothetical protein
MEDIIDSTTPLELDWAGVHPRVFLTPARLAFLKKAILTEPYSHFYAQVRRCADAHMGPLPPDWTRGDPRSLGCVLPHLALMFLLTGEVAYRERALTIIRSAPLSNNPGLTGGHILGGLAIAYDWLYSSFSPDEKVEISDLLMACGTYAFEQAGLFQRWTFIILTCNHLPVEMSALTAAGCVLYGERPGISRWLKLCVEKARSMVQANGDDGASHEGIGYGQYYNEFFVKYLLLIKELLGVDLFRESAYLKNLPLFYLHSSLSREAWTAQNSLINFGDGVRYNWYGPDSHLRPLASIYRDSMAQWLADQHLQAETAMVSGSFLNLTHYDPSVPAEFPAHQPRSHRFADKDFVFQRSGWGTGESLLAFRCGPHFGHHVLTRYTSEIGGGHMQANNGTIYLMAGGDYLISGDGYFKKCTAYGNTLRVNGKGQIGEGGEWFESLALRRAQRGPRIIAGRLNGVFEYTIGDLAPAYPDELRIRRMTRKILYLRPTTWILVDEIETVAPMTFEARFHSDFPFASEGGSWHARGSRFGLRLTAGGTVPWVAQTSVHPCENVNGAVTRRYPLLTLEAQKVSRAALVTVLEVAPINSDPVPAPEFITTGDALNLSVTVATSRINLRIRTLLDNPLAIGVEF